MEWLFASAGLVLGVLLGVAMTLMARRRNPGRTEPTLEVTPTEPASLPPDLAQVLDMLRSANVLIGPHDEVLRSSVQARTFGLVRGTRIANAELLELVRTVRRTHETAATDLELRRGAGAMPLHLAVRIGAIGDNLVLLLAEDRTAAKRVDETRRDFVANVSHELKTPIGAIGLLAEAVEDAADDPEAVRRFAGRMSKESSRLAELVAQIIDLSRLQSDDPMLRAAEVSIDSVLIAAVNRSREAAEKHDITLTIAGEKDLLVLGDPDQLTDAVANLVHNAVVYSDDGARVAVSARRTREEGEDWVAITVSDNGIGIAPEDLRRIFERFYRVDYARSRANGGTGLGLSIVKHIAGVHGGSVSVWSQVGQGSTFTIRIPALTQSSTPALANGSPTGTIVEDHTEGTA